MECVRPDRDTAAVSLWVGIRQKYRVGQVVWYNNEPWIVTSFRRGNEASYTTLELHAFSQGRSHHDGVRHHETMLGRVE